MVTAGRPTIYTEELADEVCRRISSGRAVEDVSFDEDMPCSWTIYHWRNTNEDFSRKFARAKEDRTEAYTGRLVGYAKMAEDKDGLDPTRLAVAINAIDKAARLQAPKKLEIAGPNGGAQQHEHKHTMSDEASAMLGEVLGSLRGL